MYASRCQKWFPQHIHTSAPHSSVSKVRVAQLAPPETRRRNGSKSQSKQGLVSRALIRKLWTALSICHRRIFVSLGCVSMYGAGISILFNLTPCHPLLQTELYKRGGLVFFETFWKGVCYNFRVLEEHLPMLTSKCFQIPPTPLFPSTTLTHPCEHAITHKRVT